MVEIKRTHDELYLHEDRYNNPKEYFKLIAQIASDAGVLGAGKTACDFGCATGEFLYFMSKAYAGSAYFGYDIMSALVDRARERVSNVTFEIGSILDPMVAKGEVYDATFLLGVHSIFDDFTLCFDNLLRSTKPRGRCYVFGQFNPYPIDVWVKYKLSDSPDMALEAGWNNFSIQSISRWLHAREDVASYRFIPFHLPFDLPPNQKDSVRSWTHRDADGNQMFINGLGLILHNHILEISMVDTDSA
jgi:SAM-dependent methyltransferase